MVISPEKSEIRLLTERGSRPHCVNRPEISEL
jgi:hypothetical protein